MLRSRLRRLERAAEGELIAIPQRDGTVAKFARSAYRDAFLNAIERLGAGEDAPPRHPLLIAAESSSDPRWRVHHFADLDYPGSTDHPIEDLSE